MQPTSATESIDDGPHFTLWDLSNRLSINRSTVWRWWQAGRLPRPSFYLGNSPRWLRSTIHEFEANLAANPVPNLTIAAQAPRQTRDKSNLRTSRSRKSQSLLTG
jgi:predicted DNA-binding transcriptional regulator AlpA